MQNVLQKPLVEHSSLLPSCHSSVEALQDQSSSTVGNTQQTMSLPGKSARPLKKRRFVSIEPEEDAVVASPSPRNDDSSTSSSSKAEESKAKRARTNEKETKCVVSPSPSPPVSPSTEVKKSVKWNDPGGNMIHMQPDPTQLYPFFNEKDVWYTVSQVLVGSFIFQVLCTPLVSPMTLA